MTENASPEKVTDLWLDDGNLIIIAGNKVFRLYQGLLARRSPIFKQILSIPQPDESIAIDATDQTILERIGVNSRGCAVVRLTDDPREVEWFLSAFFGDNLAVSRNGLSLYSDNVGPLSGILRLSNKYEVSFLHRWAVSCLERLFPLDPKAVVQATLAADYEEGLHLDTLLALLDVAVIANVPWIQPAVYWHLHHAPVRAIMECAQWGLLTDPRRVEIIVAREHARDKLKNNCQLLFDRTGNDVAERHERNGKCVSDVETLMVAVLLTEEGPRAFYNATDAISVDFDAFFDSTIRCKVCKTTYLHSCSLLLTKVFTSVLESYGLPDMAELVELQAKYHTGQ